MRIREGSVKVCGAAVATVATLALSTVVFSGGWAESAEAAACSALTEQIRKEEPGASGLPDCRAYDQVSPVLKNGLDAIGGPYTTQASATGDRVSYYSLVPFPGIAGAAEIPSYLGSRDPTGNGWSSQGLQPPAGPGSSNPVIGLTEDLAKTILLAQEPPLAAGATFGATNAYVRDNATGSYELLAPDLVGQHETAFVDAASGDLRILFESNMVLSTSNFLPAPGHNLYEWNEALPVGERVSLAGVVPPVGKQACGGLSEPSCEAARNGSYGGPSGGAVGQNYTQNTISRDGSRIFFTDIETGFVYMREPVAKRTARVSAGVAPAVWLAATPSGSFVFYTEGTELYRFNAGEDKIDAVTGGAEGVLGTLGVSDDGSYVYFVAHGKLATNKNGNKEEAVEGAANLYEWHEGVTTFIAGLSEEANWRGFSSQESGEKTGPAGGNKSSRVSPNGKAILFSSKTSLTGYPTNNNTEFYLYDAGSPLSASNPMCVSCNPTGVAATSPETRLALEGSSVATTPVERSSFLTHNLSDGGSRVFFQSKEALVPGDVNQQLDVYEWERDGAGSCESASVSFSEQDGGCLYMVSTGQSLQQSFFGNADAEGKNVFFFTRQSLVGQDRDENNDLYDASVEGGILAQNPPSPPAQCAEESTCRGQSPSAPSVLGTPPSTTFSGSGNLPEQVPGTVPAIRVVTRAQKLAKALRVCRSKPKSKRKGCEAAARRLYGSKSKTKKASRRGGRNS